MVDQILGLIYIYIGGTEDNSVLCQTGACTKQQFCLSGNQIAQ